MEHEKKIAKIQRLLVCLDQVARDYNDMDIIDHIRESMIDEILLEREGLKLLLEKELSALKND